jgi:hypothetical protein
LSEHTTTECLLFPDIFPKPVVVQFDQREGSSDGGAILLQAADRRYGLTERMAACLRDERQAGKIDHQLTELLRQRVYGIACGYPDANDADRLAIRFTNCCWDAIPSRERIWLRSRRCRGLKTRWIAKSCTGWAQRWPTV